jgi:hypothetical protein
MLCGLLLLLLGRDVAGFDIMKRQEKITDDRYVSKFSLYDDLTVAENLLFGGIYGLSVHFRRGMRF